MGMQQIGTGEQEEEWLGEEGNSLETVQTIIKTNEAQTRT